MIVSTFSMPSGGSAPTRAGAVLVPYLDRLQVEWRDIPGGVTLLRITHEATEAESIANAVTSAHPKVRLDSQEPAPL